MKDTHKQYMKNKKRKMNSKAETHKQTHKST